MKTTKPKVAKRTKTKTGKRESDGLLVWLEGRPALLGQLEEMRRITQNEEGGHDLLAQAEAGYVRTLEAMGAELMRGWLEKRNEQESRKAAETMRRHSKKN